MSEIKIIGSAEGVLGTIMNATLQPLTPWPSQAEIEINKIKEELKELREMVEVRFREIREELELIQKVLVDIVSGKAGRIG